MKYKAVLFDLDGTLLDTISDIGQSANNVLKRYNLPIHTIEEYKYLVGEGMRNLIKKALPENLRADQTIDQITHEMREEYDKHWADNTTPYAGIADLLDFLTENKLKLTVLSNKPDFFTKKVVDKFLGKWHFDVVFGERANIPIKPDPAGAIEIASILKINKEDFLYLGDTSTDMITANKAGMNAVGVTWGFRKIDELKGSGAKYIIHHPLDLTNIIL